MYNLEQKIQSRVMTLKSYLVTATEMFLKCRNGDKMQHFWLARKNTLAEEVAYLESILKE